MGTVTCGAEIIHGGCFMFHELNSEKSSSLSQKIISKMAVITAVIFLFTILMSALRKVPDQGQQGKIVGSCLRECLFAGE